MTLSTPPLIALLTDFGLADPYVGQMKAAILARAPEARLVDLCHEVAPGDVAQAGFFLAASEPHFPPGTVFAAVVDPGVGTDRRLIVLDRGKRRVLAPDNGLTSLLEPRPGQAVYDVTPAIRPETATFHGRDVIAPLAALLALGRRPESLGRPADPAGLVRLPQRAPRREGDMLHVPILHVDRFGDVVLALPVAAWRGPLMRASRIDLVAAAEAAGPGGRDALELAPVETYAATPPGRVGILPGSQGFFELAVNGGSAALTLGLVRGGSVTLRLAGA